MTPTVLKNDPMTAGGQMIMRGHNEALPPVALRVNIPVMAVRVSGSNPYRTRARRLFPPSGLPGIGIAVVAMIAPYPNMLPAWTRRPMFMDTNRGPKPYDDLSMSGYYPQGKAEQRGQNQFSHLVLLGLLRAGGWPFIISPHLASAP